MLRPGKDQRKKGNGGGGGGTHLRASVNAVEHRPRQRIPKPNLPICRPSSRSQKTPLMRTPSDSLDSRTVLLKLPHRFTRIKPFPDEQLVVVPPARQLPIGGIPPQPTHLLPMAGECPKGVFGRSNVPVEDCSVARAGRKDRVVPR